MRIAIDGPAGAGKSTIARLVAQKLGLRYLDTGAMYRAVTLQALLKDAPLDNEARLINLITSMDLEIVFEPETGANLIFIDGQDMTEEIRLPEVSNNVSLVSSHGKVRELIVALQKQIGLKGQIVMDGRDIGTIVMPEAEWKFFLVASVEERARRRQKELEQRGHKVALEELEEQIAKRDHFDSTRENSPLCKAEDAIEIDSTALGISEVVSRVLELIEEGTHDVQASCNNSEIYS